MVDQNIVFTGGSDCKIKMWNLSSGKCEKEIVGHKSVPTQLILIENPFELRVDKSFIIVSLGKDEDFLRVSTPYTPINNALILNYRIMCRSS